MSKGRQRRFRRYSLRAGLVVVTLVTVALGWTTYRAMSRSRALAAVRRVDGFVHFQLRYDPEEAPSGAWQRLLRWAYGDETFAGVDSVDVAESDFGDAELALVAALSEIGGLDLTKTRVTDAGAEALVRLRKLEWLDISETKIGDYGLATITELPRLQHLTAAKTSITARGLDSLARKSKIRHLNLNWTEAGDSALESLTPLATLESLHLMRADVTADGLRHLASMRNLRHISLDWTEVDDVGVSHLCQAKSLVGVSLDWTNVTDQALIYLERLPNLRGLSVEDSIMSPEAVSAFMAKRPRCRVYYSRLMERAP